jgi:hypothetical protein
LASGVVTSSLTSVGNLTAGGIPYSLLTGTIPTWNQNTTGNAATATTANSANTANSATTATTATTATKLATPRSINGVAFDGSADITIDAAAGTLTGTSLAAGITGSSLTTVGTITTGTWNANTISVSKGGTGSTSLNGILVGNSSNAVTTAAYGSFYDLTTQTLSLANTAYALKLNNTDFANGVAITNDLNGNPTRIKVLNTGKYNLQFSAQLDRVTGTTSEDISIWLRKNDSDLINTSTDIAISGSSASSAPTVAAWNFFLNLNANDYIEIFWSGTSTNLIIKSQGTRTAPVRPAIPSVIVTVQQVY